MDIGNIQEEQKLLAEAHDAWRETEMLVNPPPRKMENNSLEVDWWRTYGWAFVIVITCLAIFVAARTGYGIYNVNVTEGFTPWMAFALMVLGLIGIEGLIVTFGFFRPRKIETTKAEDLLEKLLFWGSLGIGIVISAASGMRFFMQIAEELYARWGIAVDRTLSLSLGVGLTFVLFGVTEFAGRLKWVHDNTPRILEHEYQKAYKAWNEDMLNRWKGSAVYLELMGEKEIRRRQIKYDLENATKGRSKVLQGRLQSELEALQSGSVQYRPNRRRYGPTKTDLIHAYLNENTVDGNVPEIQEIQEWLQMTHGMTAAKSTVSDARSSWRRNGSE